jgi:hypothetical protein
MKDFSGSLFAVGLMAAVANFSNLCAQEDNAAPAAPETAPADGGTGATGPGADSPTGAVTNESATFQTFYDGLAGQGTWIQTQQFGYVWQPQVTDPNWAPYTDGYWAYSDQGWFWVSNEAWGWATYHYGRWANLDGTGWVWVPGYVWAPAWVSWRYGNGYTGWAPLPPDSLVGTDYAANAAPDNNNSAPNAQPDMGDDSNAVVDDGYHIGDDDDDYYGIGAGLYIFLPLNFFCYHDYHGHYCNRGDNFSIINGTRNVTNINVGRNGPNHERRVTVNGPSKLEIDAASSTPVQRVTIARANQPGLNVVNGNTVSVFAPHIHASSTAVPTRVGMSIGATRVNHGIDITRPLVVNNRVLPTQPTNDQIAKAHEAQGQAPASAKVLTDVNTFKAPMSGAVSTMRPITTPVRAPEFANGTQGEQRQVNVPSTRVFSQTGQEPIYPAPNESRTVAPGAANPYARSTTANSGEGSSAGGSHIVHAAPSSSGEQSAPERSSSSSSSSSGQQSTSSGGWSAPASSSGSGTSSGSATSGPVGGFAPSSSAHH